VREELRARRVQLVVDVDAELPTLRVDAGQIRQALLNLIRNAAEAMPDGGAIRLEARLVPAAPQLPSPSAPPPSVEVTVSDTGAGVAPEDLERVFEPFYTSKQGGTGLGLAISREIAMEHGGTLTCESVSGKGTTFRLTLPISGPEIGR
jgi:signal transduction histidine kinase